MGADYLMNGWSLFKHKGKGTDWSWQPVSGSVNSSAQGASTEMSVARSSIGDPESVRVLFRSDNSAFSASPRC